MGLEPITTRILPVITYSEDFNLLQNLEFNTNKQDTRKKVTFRKTLFIA
jgi:hypothetical protein